MWGLLEIMGLKKKIQSEKKLETNSLFSSNNLREESKLMNAPKSGKSLDTSPNPGWYGLLNLGKIGYLTTPPLPSELTWEKF